MKKISKKILFLCLSIIFVLGFSIQAFSDADYKMKNVSYDRVLELEGKEIEIEFDENGSPKSTTGIVPYASGVTCVWSLQRRAGYDNMYTMLYTVTATNDYVKTFSVDSLIAKNASALSSSDPYYDKSYSRTFDQAYRSQTAAAGNFLVNDGATKVRLISKGVSVYLLNNGYGSLTNGGGYYNLSEVD